ncbi:uncharacterized protein METZ01_LOCUS356844, partial [marine metagenome]
MIAPALLESAVFRHHEPIFVYGAPNYVDADSVQ